LAPSQLVQAQMGLIRAFKHPQNLKIQLRFLIIKIDITLAKAAKKLRKINLKALATT
jgi:hypothetical protein